MNHTVYSAQAAAENREMNSDEQRADRALRLARRRDAIGGMPCTVCRTRVTARFVEDLNSRTTLWEIPSRCDSCA